MNDKQRVLKLVRNLAAMFVSSGRVDGSFKAGDIDTLVNKRVVTIDDITREFRKELVDRIKRG